jgi:uncharacterized protein YfaS (alpha-2-macroglobulin family)
MLRWMKPLALAGLLLALLVTSKFSMSKPLTAADRPAQWKKVQEAIDKGLPKTAIQELEPIIESALAEKAYPEAVKAITKKIAFEGMIEGNKPEERITRMQAEIAKAPKEMIPVMDAMLAHWYWHYFQQNRWRFVNRTGTTEAPGKDFTTWDLKRLFKEIDAQFTKSLKNEQELKAIPIAAFNGLLESGTLSDAYRPTLWDFLAFEALTFYTSPEQAGAKTEDAFEFEAGSPALANFEAFINWKPNTTDTESNNFKAIQLYQQIISFHQKDADKTPLLDADLSRLQWGYNTATGEGKASLYKLALKRFAEANAGHELSAMAWYRLAEVIRAEGDLVEAKSIAENAVKAYPKSPGGLSAYNLIKQIEAKEIQVQTERVWVDNVPMLRVRYRNLTKVNFRMYKADWYERVKRNQYLEQLDHNELTAILKKKPDAEFAADLPETADYATRSHDLKGPAGLKPGWYFLLSSEDPKFQDGNNQVLCHYVWVTDLALVMRTSWTTAELSGFLLKAVTGEPVADAKVEVWRRLNNNTLEKMPDVKTDGNGIFKLNRTIDRRGGSSYVLLASHEDQQISMGSNIYWYGAGGPANVSEQTVFFTDRSIYRPGQTIQFKGICLKSNILNDQYEVLPNRNVEVILQDVNGQQASTLKLRSNDYGSFSGSFTAPRDRLMGQYHLVSRGAGSGATHFNIEEYKRPKFEVTLDTPAEPAKLDGEVKLVGQATGYTGAAISSAKVRYRVVREVRYPQWCYSYFWWRMPTMGESQEIAHGTAITGADGKFPISFVARADKSVAEKDEPIFRYTISADVTDTTGETRVGSRTVQVAYTALQANVTADGWQTTTKPVKLTVSTTTPDGDGQPARGAIKIHKLKQPEKVIRPDLLDQRIAYAPRRGRGAPKPIPPKPDPADMRTWELGEVVQTLDLETDPKGNQEFNVKLGEGPFTVLLESKDRFGKAISSRLQLVVLNPEAKTLPLKVANHFNAPKWTLEPGDEFNALWGTGYEQGRAFVEVEHRGKLIQSYWTPADRTINSIKQKIEEAHRGGFTVRTTFVHENRAFFESRHVDVPWTNKQLTVKWERFVSKLEPGKKETWTAVITGPDAKKAVAEMVATLYDKSLDQFAPHNWLSAFNVFRQDYSPYNYVFENHSRYLNHILGMYQVDQKGVPALTYRHFPADLTQNIWGYMFFGRNRFGAPPGGAMMLESAAGNLGGGGGFAGRGGEGGLAPTAAPRMAKAAASSDSLAGLADSRANGFDANKPGVPNAQPPVDLSQVSARTNLNETAFFFPKLISDDSGTIRMEFTMPEALTKWKFMGFAHDAKLRSGFLTGETVTAKDLMVQPNPPRFLREGDLLEFSVKVSNMTSDKQLGKTRLTFSDTRTGANVDAALANANLDQSFELGPKESKSFYWKITVPDGIGPITYKAVGATEKFSDGEEGVLPVLTNRILVTESIQLPIRGIQTRTFDFAKLRESATSNTLKHQSLTVQMTSNPSWYAVMALPYLMEYPHECSEQTFNRLYANTLARHIANSDPKIRKVFDQWKNTPALDSPLEKNQDLKSVMLEETPWVRDAKNESQARRNVGILFDSNRLNEETARLDRRMKELQSPDGGWSWFPGGPINEYITLYITTGYGRLRHLGVKLDVAPAVRATTRLDAWADEMYRNILRDSKDPTKNHLSTTIALYLYGRSFFLKERPVAKEHQGAVNYWLNQAQKYWLQLANRQSQAHIAIGLKRFGVKEVPMNILASIKERSVSNEEMGRFWRDTEASYWWYHAPIETQAMMIEAFSEVADDPEAVEDCKVWLLKQKQTQNWKTTKSTADAIYALLLRGNNLLASDALVEVKLGGEKVQPEKVEAGTGFYEQKFLRGEVKPQMGSVTVTKTDEGVAWGSLHWQYLENITKVTPHDGSPLKLEKKLFKRIYTKAGPTLEAVNGAVSVGDEIVVRIVLRSDRDMEYVHMKDHRGSGTEPVNVLSRYRYQDGLGYYESTKDTATHFFIDYLPKGTYVFEYSVRVQHKGTYPTGLANIECMYAPEFNSHSENITLDVK